VKARGLRLSRFARLSSIFCARWSRPSGERGAEEGGGKSQKQEEGMRQQVKKRRPRRFFVRGKRIYKGDEQNIKSIVMIGVVCVT